MTEALLPESAIHFLTKDIVSVERLDLLLFLYRNAKRWWGAQKLSAELEMPAVHLLLAAAVLLVIWWAVKKAL